MHILAAGIGVRHHGVLEARRMAPREVEHRGERAADVARRPAGRYQALQRGLASTVSS
jgi:hypothetical protein